MATKSTVLAKSALDVLSAILGAVFKTDNLTAERIEELETNFQALILNFEHEVSRVNHFKFNPHWKTRVINAPKAIDQMKRLIGLIRSELTPKLKSLGQPFIDFRTTIQLFSEAPIDPEVKPLVRGYQELQQFIDALNSLVGDVNTAMKNASELTQMFDQVLSFFEELDQIFLQQGNSRKRARESAFIRVGKLHE